jgi:hypothetical protein
LLTQYLNRRVISPTEVRTRRPCVLKINCFKILTPKKLIFALLCLLPFVYGSVFAFPQVANAAVASPPATPTNLVVRWVSSSQINLTWQDNSNNEQGFKIERKTGTGGTYSQIAILGPDVELYCNTRLTPSTVYYYRLMAYNDATGDSSYSNEISATTLPPPPPIPTLKLPSYGATISTLMPRLEWDSSTGAVSYGVQVATDYGFTSIIVSQAVNGGKLYYDLSTPLSWNTTYYWRGRAIASSGSASAWSNPWSFGTAADSDYGSRNIVINHTNWDWYNSQAQQVFDRVAAQKIYFSHASIGSNIMSGFTALHSANPLKYPLNQIIEDGSPASQTENGMIYHYPRGNPGWSAKVSNFESYVLNGWRDPKVDIAMNKFCYIDQNANLTTYLDSMAALEAKYPNTKFIYFSIPLSTDNSSTAVVRAQFNTNLRNWIATQNNKLFFDLADIESTSPSGVHNTFTYNGIAYENLYAGYTSDGGHLNAEGSRRAAIGLYSLFGQIANPPAVLP